jgi:hypothetical protein
MNSYEWIQHKGKNILYMKIASETTEELKERIENIKPVVAKEPPHSILCIADVTNGKFNPEMTQMLKEFTKHNEPYIKMTALVGVEGLKKIIYNAVLTFTKRKNLILKDSKQQALDWLSSQ